MAAKSGPVRRAAVRRKIKGYADGGEVGSSVPDYTDQYNTKLSSGDEQKFQQFASSRPNDLKDYDLRGAWKANAQAADNGHLPDTFKKPNHPTFSDQSQYNGAGGMTGGKWSGDDKSGFKYTPSATNLNMYGPKGLRDYMGRGDPGVTLDMAKSRGGKVKKVIPVRKGTGRGR